MASTLVEVLRRQKIGSAAFLTTSAFQENEVVSPLSPGVCKQNTHLPTMLRGSNFGFRWVAPPHNFTVCSESQGGRQGLFPPAVRGGVAEQQG